MYQLRMPTLLLSLLALSSTASAQSQWASVSTQTGSTGLGLEVDIDGGWAIAASASGVQLYRLDAGSWVPSSSIAIAGVTDVGIDDASGRAVVASTSGTAQAVTWLTRSGTTWSVGGPATACSLGDGAVLVDLETDAGVTTFSQICDFGGGFAYVLERWTISGGVGTRHSDNIYFDPAQETAVSGGVLLYADSVQVALEDSFNVSLGAGNPAAGITGVAARHPEEVIVSTPSVTGVFSYTLSTPGVEAGSGSVFETLPGSAQTAVDGDRMLLVTPGGAIDGYETSSMLGGWSLAQADVLSGGTGRIALDGDWAIVGQSGSSQVQFLGRVTMDTPPEADAGGPYTLDEGGSVTLDASGSTDDQGIVSYAWDLDDDGSFDDATGSAPVFTPANDGVFPVSVRVTDTTGQTDTAGADVTVANLAPVVDAGPPLAGQTGETLSGTASATDLDALTFTVDCGDGAGPQASASTAFSCTYGSAGTFTITFTADDGDGGVTSDTTTAEVELVDPGPPPFCDVSEHLCMGVLQMVQDANDAWGGMVVREDAHVSRRPSSIYDRMAALLDELEDGQCLLDPTSVEFMAGTYGKPALNELSGAWDAGALEGTIDRSAKTFSGTMVGGEDFGTTFSGYGRYRYLADRSDGGFATGIYARVAGKKGVFFGVHGVCDAGEDVETALSDWYRGPLTP